MLVVSTDNPSSNDGMLPNGGKNPPALASPAAPIIAVIRRRVLGVSVSESRLNLLPKPSVCGPGPDRLLGGGGVVGVRLTGEVEGLGLGASRRAYRSLSAERVGMLGGDGSGGTGNALDSCCEGNIVCSTGVRGGERSVVGVTRLRGGRNASGGAGGSGPARARDGREPLMVVVVAAALTTE